MEGEWEGVTEGGSDGGREGEGSGGREEGRERGSVGRTDGRTDGEKRQGGRHGGQPSLLPCRLSLAAQQHENEFHPIPLENRADKRFLRWPRARDCCCSARHPVWDAGSQL